MWSRRLAKLKAMPPREIAHRVWYSAYTGAERWAVGHGRFVSPDRLKAALVPEIGRSTDWTETLLARSATGRFFAWEDSPEAIRHLFAIEYRDELAQARALADQVGRHEIAFFGETFRFAPTVNWHADPVTGAEWPRRYHRDVPVHGGNVGYGDVKYVWELNRHQFLVDLARIVFLDRSQTHAAALFRFLKSWLAAVPYGIGAPWACALEPAFRVWSWMWAYSLVRHSGMLSDDIHLEWLTGFYDHGRFLYRHLEHYASPYNHLIGEASALFALGISFREFRESAAWARRGREVLESKVSGQFYPDGGTVEQSTFYHHATLGFYILAALLAGRNDVPLSLAVLDSIERGIDFSAAMTQPNGRLPSIGGADDGKPIRLEHLPFWDFRPYQAIGAVMFSRSDFKTVAEAFPEDALWLLGTDGLATFKRLPPRPPATTRAFPASGYYVVRSGWSPDADYVCFDCGEQAAGLRHDDVPSAAHGHADCLSVVVMLAGHPVLIDPGFFCYNGDPEWEVHFRKTGAHTTLTVNGKDQARHISKMAWTHTYTAKPEGWSPEAHVAWARGSHNGYADIQNGVIHRRTVWLRDTGYVILYDEIAGTGQASIKANFQFAPGTLTVDGQCAALFEDRFDVAWICTVDAAVSTMCGEPGPGGGWVATSLGVRQAAPRLVLEFPFAAPRAALLTIIADRHRNAPTRSRIELVPAHLPQLLAARIHAEEWDDLIVASDGQAVRWRGVETDASVGIVRLCDGRPGESCRIGGTHLRVAQNVFVDADAWALAEAARPGK